MTTVIGPNTRIRGRILGATDIEVYGQLEGDLSASGEVVIETGALVLANVEAARIVVRGAVRGNLNASEALVLEDGARVIGDLRAGRIGIAEGALVRGYVESAGVAGNGRRTTSAAANRPAPKPVSASKPQPAAKPAPAKPALAPVAKPAPASAPAPLLGQKTFGKPAAKAPAPVAKKAKVAPAPTVPAVKKGTKTALKTKRA